MIDKPLNAGIDVAARQLDRAKDVAVAAHRKVPVRYWVAMGALIGAVMAGVVAGYLQRDFGKRNLEYQPWPDMSISKAAESQTVYAAADGASPLPWGATDLAPPEGTVYRGQKTYTIHARELDSEAVINNPNPYAMLTGTERERVLARGADLFRYTCQGCHGVDGVGSAPVVKYGVPAPAIADAAVRARRTDGQLFHIITHGFNTMKPHAAHLDYDDRWKVVLYLRKLQQEAN